MDGFWEGVQYYNKQKEKKVQVLGWDENKQKAGTFANSFTDQNKGKQITRPFSPAGCRHHLPGRRWHRRRLPALPRRRVRWQGLA